MPELHQIHTHRFVCNKRINKIFFLLATYLKKPEYGNRRDKNFGTEDDSDECLYLVLRIKTLQIY